MLSVNFSFICYYSIYSSPLGPSMNEQDVEEIYSETVEEVYTQQPQQQYATSQPTVITTGGGGGGPDVILAYVLWLCLGWLGVHHLYMGRGVGIWLVSLFSLQGLGFWWIADLFLIPGSCSKVRGNQTIIIQQ